MSTRGDPLDACLRQLARLKSDAGLFGCMGNHEHYSGAELHTTEQGARLYNEHDQNLLTAIAGQAAIALQNARLFEQTQRQARETAQLYSASQRLATMTQLDEAMAAVADSVPVADINRVVLWLFERDKSDEVTEAVVSASWYSGEGTPALPSGRRTPCRWSARSSSARPARGVRRSAT